MTKDELDKIIKENYPHEPLYKDFDLERWSKFFFKDILEDENDDIHKKYKDIINDQNKYDSSYDKLYTLNNEKEFVFKCKPTHHHLYVPYENIKELPKVDGKFSEQRMINNLYKYIRKNINENDKQINEIYLQFVIGITKIFKQIDKSKNKEIFMECFNTGKYLNSEEEKKFKDEYHEIYYKKKNRYIRRKKTENYFKISKRTRS